MIALIDSSVLLRKLFGEADALAEWNALTDAYASRILPVEVARVIDRCRLDGRIDDEQVAQLHEESRRVLRSIEIVALTDTILDRAGAAMPSVVGTLDGIHLATALELRHWLEQPVVMATHDRQLARAARASGLTVCGI